MSETKNRAPLHPFSASELIDLTRRFDAIYRNEPASTKEAIGFILNCIDCDVVEACFTKQNKDPRTGAYYFPHLGVCINEWFLEDVRINSDYYRETLNENKQ